MGIECSHCKAFHNCHSSQKYASRRIEIVVVFQVRFTILVFTALNDEAATRTLCRRFLSVVCEGPGTRVGEWYTRHHGLCSPCTESAFSLPVLACAQCTQLARAIHVHACIEKHGQKVCMCRKA